MNITGLLLGRYHGIINEVIAENILSDGIKNTEEGILRKCSDGSESRTSTRTAYAYGSVNRPREWRWDHHTSSFYRWI